MMRKTITETTTRGAGGSGSRGGEISRPGRKARARARKINLNAEDAFILMEIAMRHRQEHEAIYFQTQLMRG